MPIEEKQEVNHSKAEEKHIAGIESVTITHSMTLMKGFKILKLP